MSLLNVPPPAPHYEAAPLTKADLNYADLPIIDLSKTVTQRGQTELTSQVRDALLNHGFFYVINHGYTPEQAARMTDIADVPFTQVSSDEQNMYLSNVTQTGSFQGYKLRKSWVIDNGVRDQIDSYNLSHDVTRRKHPEALRPFLSEVQEFAKHNHFNVLHPILRIMALGLELPEETFVDMHNISNAGESQVAFLKYYPRTEDDELKTNGIWLKGHTDSGTITILYSQPIAGLQILTKDGTWKWVRHVENALIINTGDALEFLSGGFYKPTIHRVVRPPEDQRNYERLKIIHFFLPDDAVKLAPVEDSPVLQRVGINSRLSGNDPPTMEQWRLARTIGFGVKDLKRNEEGNQEELINGILVTHYN